MAEKKKTKTTKSVVKRSRAKSTPTAVPVKRTRRAPRTKKEYIIDLSEQLPSTVAEDMFSEVSDYQEPYQESPIFDINEEATSVRPARWSLHMYHRIAVTFIVLSLLSLGAVLYLTYIHLDITIHPKASTVEAKTDFTVYDRPEDYQMPGGSVLGLVRAMEVETTQTVPTSGKEVVGADVNGTVTIINNYTKDQPLVATTRLLTPNNQLLRLTTNIVVPAGGQVEAKVYAETTDPSFTLANTHLTIPGLWAGLQDKIYAEAKAGAVTYQEKTKLSVAQADINEAIRQGKIAVLEKARAEIDNAYGSYDEKLYELDEASVVATPDSQVGDDKEAVSVKLMALVNIVTFNKKDIAGLLGTALTAAGSQAEPLAGSEPMFTLTAVDVNDNVAKVGVQTTAPSTIVAGQEIVKPARLIGLRRSQVEEYLRGLDGVESFELKFRPSFWPWAPYNARNISVVVQ